jgi:hypothetical protein
MVDSATEETQFMPIADFLHNRQLRLEFERPDSAVPAECKKLEGDEK